MDDRATSVNRGVRSLSADVVTTMDHSDPLPSIDVPPSSLAHAAVYMDDKSTDTKQWETRGEQTACLNGRRTSPTTAANGTTVAPTHDGAGHAVDTGSDVHTTSCPVCHRFEPAFRLDCEHQVCTWCARMHGCGVCGALVTTREPVDCLDGSGMEDALRAPNSPDDGDSPLMSMANTGRPGTCSTISPYMDEHDANGAGDQDDASCMICENRRQAARLTCKNQCVVFTCGACAAKHRQCFMCNSKVIKVEEDGDDEHMFSVRTMGCDVCSMRSRVLLIECRMGCQFRVCRDCHAFTTTCCGFPVRSGGEILASSPQRQSIDWRSNPDGRGGSEAVGRSSKLSARQDSGTSAPSDVQRRVQRYMEARQSVTRSHKVLKPVFQEGGFMGYGAP
eukprot:m.100430 g.100430  ORF g.100430 m.100430 type:complete len:391 (-) comp10348_c2_seq1:111-1283(-)